MWDTKIITVANQKGGCGKTTVTMQLAGALGRDGRKILVVDADPQGTAMRWAASAPENCSFPTHIAGLSAVEAKLHIEVKKYLGDYEYIFIDCPPAVNSLVPQSALIVSDLVIIPVIPSPADLWAAVGIQELIEKTKIFREHLNARLLANMCQQHITLNHETLEILNNFGIELLKNNLSLRTAYRQSAVYGGTVFDIKDTSANKAKEEIQNLKNEILALL